MNRPAEVSQLEVAVEVDENVLRLYVAMNDVVLVAIFHCVCYLLTN